MRQHSTQPPSLLSSRLCPQRSTFHGHLFLENIESDALSTPDTGRNDMLPWLVTQPYMYVLHGTAAQKAPHDAAHCMQQRDKANDSAPWALHLHSLNPPRISKQSMQVIRHLSSHHIKSSTTPTPNPPNLAQILNIFILPPPPPTLSRPDVDEPNLHPHPRYSLHKTFQICLAASTHFTHAIQSLQPPTTAALCLTAPQTESMPCTHDSAKLLLSRWCHLRRCIRIPMLIMSRMICSLLPVNLSRSPLCFPCSPAARPPTLWVP